MSLGYLQAVEPLLSYFAPFCECYIVYGHGAGAVSQLVERQRGVVGSNPAGVLGFFLHLPITQWWVPKEPCGGATLLIYLEKIND